MILRFRFIKKQCRLLFSLKKIIHNNEPLTAFGGFRIPKLYIFGTVASGLVFGVVVGLTMIICKHKKQADERTREYKAIQHIQEMFEKII